MFALVCLPKDTHGPVFGTVPGVAIFAITAICPDPINPILLTLLG